MGVGERIRQVRGTRTQREFAALLDVDQNTLSKWELEKQMPDMRRLRQIADLGNVPLAWMFSNGDEASGVPPADMVVSRRLDQVERELVAAREDIRRVREEVELVLAALRRRRGDS